MFGLSIKPFSLYFTHNNISSLKPPQNRWIISNVL